MTDPNRPLRTVSEELDLIGRHPEGVPDIPQEIIEAFADEYEKPDPAQTQEAKLGRQTLALYPDEDKKCSVVCTSLKTRSQH